MTSDIYDYKENNNNFKQIENALNRKNSGDNFIRLYSSKRNIKHESMTEKMSREMM